MKFKVAVTLTAKKTFEYEIEAESERRAGDEALDRAVDEFADHPPTNTEDDFDMDCEQITQICDECGKEYVLDSDEACREANEFCAECGPRILAEEAKKEVGN